MIPSSLFNFIVAEFSKRKSSTSWHYVDMPSYEDISTVLESVVEWAKQNGNMSVDGKIDVSDITG